MVIMDVLDEEYNSFNMSTTFLVSRGISQHLHWFTTLPVDAEKYLGKRLNELHQANFVHGDVQDLTRNIMLRKDGSWG